jgi:multiple sugar transport system substrate-binding protein
MCIGSTGGASHQVPNAVDGKQPFEVGIATLPQVDPENPKAISQGPSLCIFDQENKQEVVASWLFVKFITTDAEFQASFSMASGYMPVIYSAKNIPTYAKWLENANGNSKQGVIALVTKTAFENTESYFVSPAFNGSSKARDQVGILLQYCLTTQAADIDQMILDAFKEAIQECLSDL